MKKVLLVAAASLLAPGPAWLEQRTSQGEVRPGP